MGIFCCFSVAKKTKKNKDKAILRLRKYQSPSRIGNAGIRETAAKPIVNGGPVGHDAYDGEDERNDTASIKREFSDFDLHARAAGGFSKRETNEELTTNAATDTPADCDGGDDGHVSDPGVGRVASWASLPKLKRSCSTLETREVLNKLNRRYNHSDVRKLHETPEYSEDAPESPKSVISQRSADRVMLKKYSSHQILPSRSRRLWWKLFLWTHRNLHKLRPFPNSPANKKPSPENLTNNLNLHCRRNVYVAESSSFKRVKEWMEDLETENPNLAAGGYSFPEPPEAETPPSRESRAHNMEAVVHANNVVETLHKSSNMAHLSNSGLQAIPVLSPFKSLKSIDLSNNSIVQISIRSLPKGVQELNLSKNRISVIEGLRDLTRLRVLNLSYNRISRIGQGLSKCILIKELYLTGNKISNVEGLHRLLKLKVLDLSYNKLTTDKAIGQLVANYSSLLALNLTGNPIQSHVSEDQLRKSITGLLPKLVYLNKRPVTPRRAREVASNSVARAALSGGGSGSRSNSMSRHGRNRGGGGGSSRSTSPSVRRGGGGGGWANKQKGRGGGSKARSRQLLRKSYSAMELKSG